jgi:DNA-directed RNA polymerase subunit RPC12/RpoP
VGSEIYVSSEADHCRHLEIEWDENLRRNRCKECGYLFQHAPDDCSHPDILDYPIRIVPIPNHPDTVVYQCPLCGHRLYV